MNDVALFGQDSQQHELVFISQCLRSAALVRAAAESGRHQIHAQRYQRDLGGFIKEDKMLSCSLLVAMALNSRSSHLCYNSIMQ